MMNTTKNPTKCRCGHAAANGTCKNCSVVKMSVMLANGSDDLKLTDPNGNKINPVLYSFFKNNNMRQEQIIQKMTNRFLKNNYLRHFTNVLQFYDNQNNELIAKVKIK